MRELPSERRGLLHGRSWGKHPDGKEPFSLGSILTVVTLFLTIAAIFLSWHGESGTGETVQWFFFIFLVFILCVVMTRWLLPRRPSYDETGYRTYLQDAEFHQGVNRTTVEGALDGDLFGQVNMLMEMRETLTTRAMARNRISRADLEMAINQDDLGRLVQDTDLAWIMKGNRRDFEVLLQDQSNEIRANFYVWFEGIMRKAEDWR